MAKTAMYVIDSKNYFKGVIKSVKSASKGKKIVYVTTNKPYTHISKVFKENNINPDNSFFIDCISEHVGSKPDKEPDNVIFIDSPQNLTTICITINDAADALKGKCVVFIDSLSLLLMYNDAKATGKFANFIINKLRSKDIESIVFALESDTDKDIVKQLESIVDEVKEVK